MYSYRPILILPQRAAEAIFGDGPSLDNRPRPQHERTLETFQVDDSLQNHTQVSSRARSISIVYYHILTSR